MPRTEDLFRIAHAPKRNFDGQLPIKIRIDGTGEGDLHKFLTRFIWNIIRNTLYLYSKLINMNNQVTIEQTNVKYIAKGLVYGLFWGGGEGTYPARTIVSSSMSDLTEKIMKGIDNGSLDSGMGYQRLIGAIMDITTETTIVIGGEDYVNKSYTTEFFGDLSENQQEFLEGQMFAL